MDPLVSIVMPAYNAETFIGEAIESVLAQRYANWELLIVNDGSTDGTAGIIDRYPDPRIRVLHKPNGGIGSARNLALECARGEYLCGLDADDVLPPLSISSRVPVLISQPNVDIVDGKVLFKDGQMREVLRTFVPDFEGEPFPELLALRSSCFMGFSWLIRWQRDGSPRFTTRVTHGEDLCFYLDYSPGKRYAHVPVEVLHYRRTGSTVMSNLDGLARSYGYIHNWLGQQGIAAPAELRRFRWKSRMVMVRSYVRAGRPWQAVLTLMDAGPFGDPYPL